MGQNGRKTLIYALVARGNPPVTLAEYTEFSGNFNSIAYQCLQKLPSSNNKFTYNCDNHTFNYLVHDGFTYCVVAEESAGRQLPMAFLERLKDDFVAKYGGGKAATAPANGLNKEFGPKLKEHMLYCVEHPEEISKFAQVKAQVSEVKGVMMENIEKEIKLSMETNPTTQSSPQIVDVGSVAEAISANDSGAPVYEVESLCMCCHENGMTRFLLTLIPHFRKILLSAFECPHCGERNNYVQFAGEIQPKGCHFLLDVPSGDKKMFNRQVVKAETATIKIPELDFEIPPEAQRGSLSTIEGILVRAANELEALQEERKKVDPQTAEAIDAFLVKLRACASGESHFTLILDDPAGNSFIENTFAPSPDPSLNIKFYERTPEQQAALGYLADPSQGEPGLENNLDGTTNVSQTLEEPHGSVGARAGRRAIAQGNSAEVADALFRYSAPEEVMMFPSTCSSCGTKCECRMFVTNIPYFQEVIVMASTCDGCGYRNSEVKAGGAIPDKGKKIIVHVKNVRDLSRDVIKSDTAAVKIPELELELSSGTLGGLVTTVEGLISKIGESLERVHGFTFGDSMDDSKKSKWKEFSAKLEQLKILEEPWTLIIDDALANSFVAPIADEMKDDTQLSFEEYERSWEQNEELGLNDMDTSAADVAYETADVEQNEKTDA